MLSVLYLIDPEGRIYAPGDQSISGWNNYLSPERHQAII